MLLQDTRPEESNSENSEEEVPEEEKDDVKETDDDSESTGDEDGQSPDKVPNMDQMETQVEESQLDSHDAVPDKTQIVFDSESGEEDKAAAFADDKGSLTSTEKFASANLKERSDRIMNELRLTYKALNMTTNEDIIRAKEKCEGLSKKERKEERKE